MSKWRREISKLVPQQKYLIDHATSPESLWREFFQMAVAHSADQGLLDHVIACAICVPRRIASAEMAQVIQTVFLDPLLIRQGAQCRVLRQLSERQFLDVQDRLASRIAPDRLAEMQAEFYRLLAERFEGTPSGRLREIKDDLLVVASATEQEMIRRGWLEVLDLVEVGEVYIALENFLANLCESRLAIPPSVAEKVRALSGLYGKTIRGNYVEPAGTD